MVSKVFNRSCLQASVFIAFACFLLGFVVQVFFHVLPSSSSVNLRAHNHFVLDGNVVDITAEDVRKIAGHESPEVGHDFEPVKRSTTLSGNDMNKVPMIVKAWRNAKLDWHELVPAHSSLWERFGVPKSEGKLPLLINKETLITDYLTRFHESGLSSQYGHDYGAMEAYSGCNVFRSSCVIHNEVQCDADQLCQWSTSRSLCVDAWDANEGNKVPGAGCSKPQVVSDYGFQTVQPSMCKHYVQQPAVMVTMDSEAQSMFYHFWASWSGLVRYWKTTFNARRDVHFFMSRINDPMFLQFFGLISDNCWRRVGQSNNPSNVCYCDTHTFQTSQSREEAGNAATQMLNYLQLEEVKPPADKVKIGLISRRRKRFILNEYELVQSLEKLGYECVILPLETMTLYEQMQQLRSVDVLVGMHGSGLDNSVFLHPGSVLIQLLPYHVEHKCTFRATAEAAGVRYMEWTLKDPSKAVFHWDLLSQANSNALDRLTKEEYLARGSQASGDRETLMFWINQVIMLN